MVLLHGGGQTRHSWGGTANVLADKGWRAITLDGRGHGESDWSPEQDYRLSAFAGDVKAFVDDRLSRPPFLIGASLGGLTSILLAGEIAPGIARGIVLVDIVPDMEQAGADRIQQFMAEHAKTGFDSLEEVADAVAAYNPHRPRPSDLSGLRKNVREARRPLLLALGPGLRRRHRRPPADRDLPDRAPDGRRRGHRRRGHAGDARARPGQRPGE